MKVYIVTMEGFPNGAAACNRIKCYAKAIQIHGIECEIIIYFRSDYADDQPRNLVRQGTWEGIAFQYSGKRTVRSRNLFVRKYYDWSDKRDCLKILNIKLKQDDIVLGYSNYDTFFITRYLIPLVHKKKAKYVRELCELPYGAGAETFTTVKNRKYSLKYEFSKCDAILAISDTLVTLATEHISLHGKVLKIPILVDYPLYDLDDKSLETDVPYLLHCGGLSEQKDGFLGMIEAFGMAIQKMKKPFRFYSTGTIDKSPHAIEIKRLIAQYHLENKFEFLGYLDEESLRKYLSRASLVIINKYPTQQNQYCFSTKLGEYMAATKPVIITNVGEAMNWIKDGETGYIVETMNKRALADKIVEVMSDEKRTIVGIQGKKACKENFDYHMWSERLIKFLKSLSTVS